MSAEVVPDRRSRLRTVVGLFALAVVLAAGAYVVRDKFPNLLDQEETNAEQIEALRSAALTVVPTAGTDAGWPQWRGPNRDGRAPIGPLRTDWKANPPKVLWSVPGGGGYSTFAVVNGRVFTQAFANGQEHVIALDAETGKELARYSYPADYEGMDRTYARGPRATPAVEGERVYVVGAAGECLCLEMPADGRPVREVWRLNLLATFRGKMPQWGVACSPLIEGGLLVVQPGGRGGSVVALDKATGETRWTAGRDVNGYSSPVAATCGGVRQVIAVTGESILGIRAADGEVLWQHGWETSFNGNIATPVVVGDYVFVSSGYSKGCILLKLEPDGSGVRSKVVYFRKGRVMKNHHSSCVHLDGFLYGYDDNVLRCIDLRKGEEVEDWVAEDDTGRAIAKGSVILADRHLIGLTENGTLFLAEADPKEFRFLGKLPNVLGSSQSWAAPVLVDGRIYLRDSEKIVCLDVRPAMP